MGLSFHRDSRLHLKIPKKEEITSGGKHLMTLPKNTPTHVICLPSTIYAIKKNVLEASNFVFNIYLANKNFKDDSTFQHICGECDCQKALKEHI